MSAVVKLRPARRLETRLRSAVIVLLQPECNVCGQRMDKQFLRRWNDRDVCRPCIDEMTQEVDNDGDN